MAAEPGRESREAPPGAEGKRLDAWLAEMAAEDARESKRQALNAFVAERVGATDRILAAEGDLLPAAV